MRTALAALAAVMPQRLKHLVYRWYFKWDVHPTARIGCSLVLVDHAVIGPNVQVSHFNVFRGMELLQLDRSVTIGAFNWVSGPTKASGSFPGSPDRSPSLVMGEESAIAMRHIVDCSDRVTFEPLTILGGNRSQILTHGVDFEHNTHLIAPVVIGRSSLVFGGCILLAGSRVPPRSLVAAGAVVNRDLGEELQLYGGVPARPLKAISPDNAFITREKGLIS